MLLYIAEEESDIIVSGWGDDEVDLRDDLLQRWSVMLEHWDGRDRWDPSGDRPRPSKELCKLVRCVSHYTHTIHIIYYTILHIIHTLYTLYTILYYITYYAV